MVTETATPYVVPPPHFYTYADLQTLPENSGRRYEIIHGELYVSPSPHAQWHQSVAFRLGRLIADWLDHHPVGQLYLAPVDVKFADDRVVVPDLVFVRAENAGYVGAAITCVPDVIVEVLSPSTGAYDRTEKLALYESEGVREYWIVDPRKQVVEIRLLGASGYGEPEVGGVRHRMTSAVLAGFAFDVARLFV